jgi:hypothetical protein
MAYYIFLKCLKILEEFRKNLHIKIPPKSPCINLQSLGKFKIAIFISNRISLQFLAQSTQPPRWPIQPFGPRGRPSASSSSFTCADRAPPPPHAPSCHGRHAALLLRHGETPMVRPTSITLPPLQSALIAPSFTSVMAPLRTTFTAAAPPILATSASLPAL